MTDPTTNHDALAAEIARCLAELQELHPAAEFVRVLGEGCCAGWLEFAVPHPTGVELLCHRTRVGWVVALRANPVGTGPSARISGAGSTPREAWDDLRLEAAHLFTALATVVHAMEQGNGGAA